MILLLYYALEAQTLQSLKRGFPLHWEFFNFQFLKKKCFCGYSSMLHGALGGWKSADSAAYTLLVQCVCLSFILQAQTYIGKGESCLLFVSLFSFTAVEAYRMIIEQYWESPERVRLERRGEKLTRPCKHKKSVATSSLSIFLALAHWSLLGKVVVCQRSAITAPHSSFKNQTTL